MARRTLNVHGELTEAAFQTQVLQLAGYYGWRAYHTHDSRRSQPGFPDLFLVRGDEAIAAELKTEKGRVKPEQHEWLAALELVAGIETFIWRPSDFDDMHARLAQGRHQSTPIYRTETA